MRAKAITIAVVVSIGAAPLSLESAGQTLQSELRQLFPGAHAFSPKLDSPPHFRAYSLDPSSGKETLEGIAFWTTEIEPLERGYDGPIKILVGMDIRGVLRGVVVADHHEPYGYFSIETSEFAAQFRGKDIRSPFRVGADVDAVSRATISISSATRAIRNSARRIARQLLTAPR